ncbi:peptide-methionine (S)-S-oxide reductase MsrA [Halomonas getboli]|uniref:peptide-methionine (S)-S-oxide reductase MsrA n=1 Tax=Halomonas getboli TaxID=2935862 RepID=UPI001FFE695F|nr:peptide-methionine (S)-S-oxide reductase MsrA [Halomonas getboli]MCK2183688.1 peptide-methionine (S)-S-oxide reductase MsrA [Halomonas getboli]
MTVNRMIRLPALLLAAAFAVPAAAESDGTATESAVFGGGCFWCVEQAFDEVDGVVATTSGFSGGEVKNPSYEQVSAGGTGHIEVVKVDYDPATVDYRTLLYVFWRNIDPFAVGRQFCDKGATYQSVIFVMGDEQRALAEASRDAVAERFGREIGTQIRDFTAFYPAEDYHQDFYEKNPVRYHFYKSACGRADRLEEVWGDEASAHAMP